MNSSATPPDERALSVIYFALAAGVFLYAVIVLLVLEPVGGAIEVATMRLMWLGIAVVATLGVGIARGRSARPAAEGAASVAPILVWALAEGQALAAITGTLLTGDRMLSFAGLAVFVWLWLRYPPRSFTGR